MKTKNILFFIVFPALFVLFGFFIFKKNISIDTQKYINISLIVLNFYLGLLVIYKNQNNKNKKYYIFIYLTICFYYFYNENPLILCVLPGFIFFIHTINYFLFKNHKNLFLFISGFILFFIASLNYIILINIFLPYSDKIIENNILQLHKIHEDSFCLYHSCTNTLNNSSYQKTITIIIDEKPIHITDINFFKNYLLSIFYYSIINLIAFYVWFLGFFMIHDLHKNKKIKQHIIQN